MKKRVFLLFLVLIFLSGCARPSIDKVESDLGRGKTLVVLRIICEVEGQETKVYRDSNDWRNIFSEPILKSYIANLETGGFTIPVEHYTFSDSLTRSGWIGFLLPEGYNYIAFCESMLPNPSGVFILTNNPGNPAIWRIEVPKNAQAIYVGTIKYCAKGRKSLSSNVVCSHLYQDSAEIIDETDEAIKLILPFLPVAKFSTSSLAQRHSSTLLLGSLTEVD